MERNLDEERVENTPCTLGITVSSCITCPNFPEGCSGAKEEKYQAVLEQTLKSNRRSLDASIKQFETNFKIFSEKCKHLERVCYRKDLRGKKYYSFACVLKKEPHVWGCTSDTCPFINQNLRLKTGGVS